MASINKTFSNTILYFTVISHGKMWYHETESGCQLSSKPTKAMKAKKGEENMYSETFIL
jgi:hypothetical protein